ncbi:cytochrome c-type biogenesis protein CcmH [Acidobacteria bacterium AB60]|nr:cytochrome c-type biogenesis protein CcmH [Acidobacteria bacterium AB60]
MKKVSRLNFWLKSAQAGALAIAVCFTLGATEPASRFNTLSHKLMCTCSCAQMLGECNHVGCPNSTEELALLRTGVDSNQSDKQIFDSFVAQYGATVLAAPTKEGFDLVAWIAPFAVFAAALLGTVLLIRHWVSTRPRLEPAAASPEMDALRERIRRETEADGGYPV